MNLLEMAERLDSLADRVPTLANERAKAAALAIVTDFARNHIADTSRALSNWQVGLGAPIHSVIEPYQLGEAGSTAGQSGEAMLSAAGAQIASKAPGVPLYISNAVPYIGYLNAGTDHIEAQGYTERAPIIARDAVQRYDNKDIAL